MKKLLWLFTIWLVGQFAVAQISPPALTKVQQRLIELLTPGAKVPIAAMVSGLPPRATPRSLENPDAPLKSTEFPPPAPPKLSGKPVQPRALPEDTSLVRNFNQPEAPQAVALPSAPLLRLWSPDVNEALPLPILGSHIRDRASLADPSLEASVAATQTKLNPARTDPVPFRPLNVPDPFEHHQAVRLRNPLDESPQPPLSLRPLGR
jgi:hypothetical protein